MALVILSPLLLACGLVIVLTSRGPALFSAVRVGLNGTEFRIYKFRTMVSDQPADRSPLTAAGDSRITRVGKILRRTKLDELPQLINVLHGDMSLVGPRPEDPRYVANYTARQRRVLLVRPGITSPASITYRHEEAMLLGADLEKEYTSSILPKKLDMDLDFVGSRSFSTDLKILLRTAWSLAGDIEIISVVRRLGNHQGPTAPHTRRPRPLTRQGRPADRVSDHLVPPQSTDSRS